MKNNNKVEFVENSVKERWENLSDKISEAYTVIEFQEIKDELRKSDCPFKGFSLNSLLSQLHYRKIYVEQTYGLHIVLD